MRDAFSNKVVGWATATRADTSLVLTALDYARRSRDVHDGQLIHHSDKGCQYTALRFTQRLADAGVAPSTGSVGDSYDCETVFCRSRWSDPCYDWPVVCPGVDLSAASGGASRMARPSGQ